MNTSFQHLMAQAMRLTRAGDLQRATATIQAALRPGGSGPRDDDVEVIDVEAREVPDDEGADLRERSPGGEFIAGAHAHAGSSREYKLFVPPAHRGRSLPLLVMLHGCTQDADDFAAGTRMNDAALEHGLFVLYPTQRASDNPQRCWNWFKPEHQQRGRGEPALLASMADAIVGRYGIDKRRVYVAGLSAGGAMAANLGAAYPDVFAAVGVHSGLPPRAASGVKSAFVAMKRSVSGKHVGPMPPTIVFQGDQDTIVHPLNGDRVVAASAGSASPELERGRSAKGRTYTRSVYRDREGRPLAEQWVVHGGGHAWFGGSARGSFTDELGPDASQEMLRFFLSQGKQSDR